jgi:hypothetical protein
MPYGHALAGIIQQINADHHKDNGKRARYHPSFLFIHELCILVDCND